MKTGRVVVLLAVALVGLVSALPIEAAPCSCHTLCCPQRANCSTECCTLGGYTTCGGFGMPGCGGDEPMEHSALPSQTEFLKSLGEPIPEQPTPEPELAFLQ